MWYNTHNNNIIIISQDAKVMVITFIAVIDLSKCISMTAVKVAPLQFNKYSYTSFHTKFLITSYTGYIGTIYDRKDSYDRVVIVVLTI